ncbi:MAG TPA: hypothetical protein VEW92_03260 [Nitrososphaeraceae archaeon]|nr:hypothetical protein [Nitrososphaeraceae archaeon]
MFQNILNNFLEAKRQYIQDFKPTNIIAEILPNEFSDFFPIDKQILAKLHEFIFSNPIYFKKSNISINDLNFTAYEGDVNEFYLSSKKYDTNYQPFYPTWMLSAFLLSLKSKQLGFTELIDIGAGDGRIPYCSSLLKLRSFGIELDTNLTELQNELSKKTDIKFEIMNDDASTYNFAKLGLSKPIFFVSGLPEMGEMFVDNLMQTTIQNKFESFGIVFLGSTFKKKFASDLTYYGWGEIIKKNNLKIIEEINLPTHWTNDNNSETKYLITKKINKLSNLL